VISRGTALRLDRVSLNVADLAAATAFYVGAFGFEATPAVDADPVSPICSARGRSVSSCCGEDGSASNLQRSIPGPLYPTDSRSDDLWFQHCALVTNDIAAAYQRLSAFPFTPISRYGPQRLLSGIVAFKFRDPDGHLLELIQFPRPDLRAEGGIDHSAISVADAERSIAFYAERLGLSLQSRQVNRGPAGYSKGAAGPQPNLP
jgi:catechol 2,3-dioxygenase-like lactoylglutathione lyase family enzyme